MNADVHEALRAVWHRHRDSVLNDLADLIVLVERTTDRDEIALRAHRILGSLSMVGIDDEHGILRHLENSAVNSPAPRRDEEVVDRLHDLLSLLRDTP